MAKRAFLPPAATLVLESSCYLVWLPDDPAYRAAFWGAYTDLAQDWMWELADQTDKENVRDSWLAAIAETLGCVDMACLEEIHSRLRAIEEAIYLTACCGVDGTPGLPRTSDIIPGVGDSPAFWGDEPVTDWDDYNDLLCGAAHAYVDLLKDMSEDAKAAVAGGTVLLGVAAAILATLSGAGIILALPYVVAAEATAGLIGLIGSGVLDAAAEDIEAARDDITCAILSGSGLSSVVAQAVGTAAWNGLYRWVDFDSAQATMLNGGYGEDVLAVDRTQACTCGAQDYYVEVVLGTHLGNNVYQSGVADRAGVTLRFWEDASKQTPILVNITISDDSAFGTRAYTGNSGTYSLRNTSLNLIYRNELAYWPADSDAHLAAVQHTGTGVFTVTLTHSEIV